MMRRKIPNWEIPLIPEEESEFDDTYFIEEKSHNDEVQVGKSRGISMTWKNLRVSAKVEKKNIFRSTSTLREIIHDVNGYVEPNSLVAILGASGSGKSTLMSALASRQAGDLEINGDIRVNGRKMEFKVMKTICGFVYQDDIFTYALTVSEHLHFAGKLKLSKYVTKKQREVLVNELITDVGLTECADRLICSSKYGMEKKNLSGGELKRLSVATELITNPALLFCDEPTTGLDSYTAFNLMKLMSDLTSQKAKTIVCSIHQPSAKIFDLFDQIILLQNGKVAFNGTTSDAMKFFQSIGYPYNETQNPADYLVKSLATESGQEFQSDDDVFGDVCSRFQQSWYAERVERRIKQEDSEMNFVLPENVERISWFCMLLLLTHRNSLDIVRNPSVQMMSIIKNLLEAAILGVIMLGSTTRTQEGITAFKGVLYSIITINSLQSSQQILNHFPSKMHGFLREYSTGTNTPFIFYLSHIISLMPGILIGCVLFVTLLYTMSGLKRDWYAFLATVAIVIVIRFAANAFGILVSLAINRLPLAESMLIGTLTVLNPITGIYINVRSLPWMIYWLSKRISWFYMLFLMTYRNTLNVIRDPSVQLMRIGNTLLEGVILGVAMIGSTTNTQEGITAFKGVLFSMVAINCFGASLQMLNYFPSKMPGFLREYSNGMNTPFIFYSSNLISLTPGFGLGTILYVTVVYGLTGLRRNWYVFWATTAIVIVIKFASSAFGILVSFAINSLSIADTVLVGIMDLLYPLTGVWVNVRSLPWLIYWIRYVSWLTYATEALLILQMEGIDHIRCSKSPNVPCLKNGQEVLESLGFDANNFRMDVTMICCICLIIFVLGFLVLKVKLYFKKSG